LRAIIGYGNTLRGEDGFGVEVLKQLQKQKLKDTKLIEMYQLTPELCLELLEVDEVIFIDAVYMENYNYSLILPLTSYTDSNLSHHISPFTIIEMLSSVYQKNLSFLVFSMATSSFDEIKDQERYQEAIQKVAKYLI
jgi:hydrogenase maturation protease